MNRKHLGIVKALFAGLLTFSMLGGLYLYNMKIDSTYVDEASFKAARTATLHEDMLTLKTEIKGKSDFSALHGDFIAAVEEAEAVSKEADDYVDITPFLSTIKGAQQLVSLDEENSSLINVQTSLVAKETRNLQTRAALVEKYGGAIDEDKIIYAQEVGNPKGLTTLPNKHPARLALDDVGGERIKLGTAEVVCDWDNASGCAYPSGVILIAEDYALMSYDFYYGLMLHEYAHHVQFKYAVELGESSLNGELFTYDNEWLADCMAEGRMDNYTSGYDYTCSDEHIAYGKKVWDGIIQ